jgi:hypothetical protein
MSSDRIPKMILKYQPKGKRNLGTPIMGLNIPNTGKADDDAKLKYIPFHLYFLFFAHLNPLIPS